MLALIVSRFWQLAGERQDHGQSVLADGVAVDAARAGESDTARAQLIQRKLVKPCANGLDPAQARGVLKECVTPQPRDDEYVCFRHARGQSIQITHLKVTRSSVALLEGVP